MELLDYGTKGLMVSIDWNEVATFSFKILFKICRSSRSWMFIWFLEVQTKGDQMQQTI